MRLAKPAPRALPRSTKGRSNGRLDRFEIRARAQTLQLVNPGMSLRELALAIGQPYIVVRDALMGDGVPCGTGLSQYRWPEIPEEATG